MLIGGIIPIFGEIIGEIGEINFIRMQKSEEDNCCLPRF